MSDRPLFADGWYRPPAAQELRHEFQNIYLLLRYILEKQRELEERIEALEP